MDYNTAMQILKAMKVEGITSGSANHEKLVVKMTNGIFMLVQNLECLDLDMADALSLDEIKILYNRSLDAQPSTQQFIDCVKAYQHRTKCSLKLAKLKVEEHRDELIKG